MGEGAGRLEPWRLAGGNDRGVEGGAAEGGEETEPENDCVTSGRSSGERPTGIESRVATGTCTPVFPGVLLTIVSRWEQPRCPSSEDRQAHGGFSAQWTVTASHRKEVLPPAPANKEGPGKSTRCHGKWACHTIARFLLYEEPGTVRQTRRGGKWKGGEGAILVPGDGVSGVSVPSAPELCAHSG